MANKTVLAIAIWVISNTSNAALYDRGNGLVYSDTLNVTWVNDPNLFRNMAYDSGNPSEFIQQIISANTGVIYDTPSSLSDGIHLLKESDFSIYRTDEQFNWWGAQAFIGYLNSVNYSGFSNWRLPTLTPSTGSNLSLQWNVDPANESELGGLFYNELHVGGTGFPTNSLFIRPEQWQRFWLTNELDIDYRYAWSWSNYGSYPLFPELVFGFKYYTFSTWVVRTGDVVHPTTIPIPAASVLFGSILAGFFSLASKRCKRFSHVGFACVPYFGSLVLGGL